MSFVERLIVSTSHTSRQTSRMRRYSAPRTMPFVTDRVHSLNHIHQQWSRWHYYSTTHQHPELPRMAPTVEPVSSEGEPLYFDGHHNAWFEKHHALESGTVAKAYRQHLESSAPFILSDLLPTTLRRRNARKEKYSSAGNFGTAGVSGVKRRSHVKEKHPVTFGIARVSGVQRKNAVREKHPNAGKFGTAGVSGVSRQRKGGKNRRALVMEASMGSYFDGGVRKSSRAAGTPGTSPTFDQFEDPPM